MQAAASAQAHDAVALWAEAEPRLSLFYLGVLLRGSLLAAAPFFVAAAALALASYPWWWAALCAGVGALLMLLALCVWAVVWMRLRQVRESLARVVRLRG